MNTLHESGTPAPKNNARVPERTFESNKGFLEGLSLFERGKPHGWGATPLDPYHSAIAEQQFSVRRRSEELFEHPPFYVSQPLKEFVYASNLGRINHRLEKNHESFGHRKQFNLDETPDELQEMQFRVLTGHASPAEVFVIATQLGVATYVLASLTHPYGQRIKEHLSPMRTAVTEGLQYLGAEVYDEPRTSYEVKNSSHLTAYLEDNKTVRSLLITRTRKLAKLGEDTAIHERSSFVYQLNDEQFSKIHTIPNSKTWASDVLRIRGLKDSIATALDEDDYQKAIPISTTTFAVNERLEKELLKDKKVYRERQRLISNEAMRIASEQAVLPSEQEHSTSEKNDKPRLFTKGWLKSVLIFK